MQPEPLVRIGSDVVFNHAGETLRIFANVCGIITTASQLNCGLEAKPVFPQGRIPMKKSRHDRGPTMKGKSGEPRRCAGRSAKKIDKYTLGEQSVVIGQDSNSAARSENL